MELEGLDDSITFGEEMKKEFTHAEGEILLNHGSYGSVPRRIQEIRKRFLDEMDSHPDDWYRRNVYKYWTQSKEAAAEFVNCDPQDLVFVQNATTGANTILKSYPYKADDVVLYSYLTYTAVRLTSEAVAEYRSASGLKTRKLEIKFPIESENEVVQKYEDCLKNNTNTRIAVLDYITSPTAILMPVKRIVDLCRKYGVLSMIDAAHAPGHVKLNLKELDPDFITGNFHKWLYTPRGCAILYVKREHHGWVKPLVTSWNHGMDLDKQFFKVGTNDQTPYVAVKYALEFYKRIGGMERILQYTSKLATEAQEYLLKTLGKCVERFQIPRSMESPNMRLIKLPKFPEFPCTRQGSVKFHTYVRTKYKIQCAIEPVEENLHLRISAQVYNTLDEYKKLGECFLEILQDFDHDAKP